MWFTKNKEYLSIYVKVSPNARKTEILGFVPLGSQIFGGTGFLKVSVAARPQNNQANIALIKFLSELASISKSSITLKKGSTNSKKHLLLLLQPAEQDLFISKITNQVQKKNEARDNQLF